MKNDQWFKPGDKVMRVPYHGPTNPKPGCVRPIPQMGTVYCVADVYRGPSFNAIILVGLGGWERDSIGRPVGYRAMAFRSVEEIKLCISAVQKKQAPISTHATKLAEFAGLRDLLT